MEFDILDFPLKGTVTKDDIKKAQKKLLNMALTIRDIFKRNNIQYTIMFGSLLGAIRHNGFIPWDLDFDFAVIDEDYEDAVKHLEENLPCNLVLVNSDVDEKYCASWIKVADKNSIIHSTKWLADNSFKYKGLHIDIYRLSKTTKQEYKDYLLKENLRYYHMRFEKNLIDADTLFKSLELMKNNYIKMRNETEKNDDEILAFLNYFVGKKTAIFPTIEYNFEGHTFMGPQNGDEVLRASYYGDTYMVPPEYSNRDIKIDKIDFLEE